MVESNTSHPNNTHEDIILKRSEDLSSLKLTLGVYIVVFVMKLAVYFASGVMALFAEALHTLSDIFISAFLLVAVIFSRKKADPVHMFGHARAQYAAALVAATLFLSFTSFELYKEAIPRLFETESRTFQNIPLVVGVLIVSMIIVAAPLLRFLFQKQRGAAAKAQFLELINDELGLLAALVGTLFILWGVPIADPLAAMAVATIIAINAVRLFRENLSFLLGRSPEPEMMAEVKQRALSVPGVLAIHDLRAEYIGPELVHAGLHVVVPGGISVEEAETIVEKVQRRVQEDELVDDCFIQIDAASTEDPPLGQEKEG